MRIIIVLVVTLFLSACSTSVDIKYIKWAEKICANNGGLKFMAVYDALPPNAYCNDGAIFKGNNPKSGLSNNP